MAKSKKPRHSLARPTKRPSRRRTSRESSATKGDSGSPPPETGFDGLERVAARTTASRRALSDAARKVIARSGWQKAQDGQLARHCRELVAKLRETCPDVITGRPLKASEVAGEIVLTAEELQDTVTTAVGGKSTPLTVWSDGTNELLVELGHISVKTANGFVHTLIPVSCNETGAVTIEVTFATGSPESTAGLIFAAGTAPEGPPEIVEIWGEALVALAWTAVLRVITALADAAGADLDGAGLVPAGLSAERGRVKLLVMARHEMERMEQ